MESKLLNNLFSLSISLILEQEQKWYYDFTFKQVFRKKSYKTLWKNKTKKVMSLRDKTILIHD